MDTQDESPCAAKHLILIVPGLLATQGFTLDEKNLLLRRMFTKMQTDVCITTSSRKILIECKYTSDPLEAERYEGTQKLISGHLFQVNSYLDNLPDSDVHNCCEAILLYPMAKRPVEAEFGAPKDRRSASERLICSRSGRAALVTCCF
jgi:hypothetical protein